LVSTRLRSFVRDFAGGRHLLRPDFRIDFRVPQNNNNAGEYDNINKRENENDNNNARESISTGYCFV
jgi:hypothetical protein